MMHGLGLRRRMRLCVLTTAAHCVFACLQERLELQRQAEADFAAERALVDEVVARIQQEDRMELAARRAKQADTKVPPSGGQRWGEPAPNVACNSSLADCGRCVQNITHVSVHACAAGVH